MPAGLLIAGATIASGVIKANAVSKAAKSAKQAADQSLANQRLLHKEDVSRLDPYVVRGNDAGDALSGLLGLKGDSKAYETAFDKYLASTNYKFKLDQGLSAVTSDRAARGLINSGGTLKAISKYAADLAQGATNDYF